MTIAISFILGLTLLFVWFKWQKSVRAEFIRTYHFPPGLFDKLQKKQPTLSTKDCQLTSRALRQFFLVYLQGGCRFVSMPSQVTDDLWHEFILYTRNYQMFCRKAFGRFLHHTPAVVLSRERQNNEGLRRVWWYACREENIDPRKPSRLPLLFALDAKFNIPGGYHYTPDCQALRRAGANENNVGSVHCGGDFSSTDFDGSTDGFGDASGGGDGNGGDGGGCGGGCGGGD